MKKYEELLDDLKKTRVELVDKKNELWEETMKRKSLYEISLKDFNDVSAKIRGIDAAIQDLKFPPAKG